MKFIYIPKPPEKLYPDQVIKVCDLRLDYLNKLVDFQFNRRIVTTMLDCVTPTLNKINSLVKVLDFGCGSGLSSQLIWENMPNLEIVGVDISTKAILHSTKQGFPAILTHSGEPLPFENATFDFVAGVFVMDFNIDVLTLRELRRVLRPFGKFIFNLVKRNVDEVSRKLYKRDVDSIFRQLYEAGFCSIEMWNNLTGIDTNHIIVSCGLLPPVETPLYPGGSRTIAKYKRLRT